MMTAARARREEKCARVRRAGGVRVRAQRPASASPPAGWPTSGGAARALSRCLLCWLAGWLTAVARRSCYEKCGSWYVDDTLTRSCSHKVQNPSTSSTLEGLLARFDHKLP